MEYRREECGSKSRATCNDKSKWIRKRGMYYRREERAGLLFRIGMYVCVCVK